MICRTVEVIRLSLHQMNHKSGFVNIIGNPNVGKSTLMNVLVGERLSIITSKAQTTRHRGQLAGGRRATEPYSPHDRHQSDTGVDRCGDWQWRTVYQSLASFRKP